MKLLVKTFKGLEEVLADELHDLGATNIFLERRAVSCEGDKRLLYQANLYLRTALRILVPIKTFEAHTPDEVYDGVRSIRWDEYMTPQQSFSITTNTFGEVFHNSQFITYRTKDAIVDWWKEKTGSRPNVSITSPELYFDIHISDTHVTVSLDSSGESLHKRGYRVANTQAPINEVLAAGMLRLAGWDGSTDFYDPMCGSGTIPIEAALMARNIPAGICRSSFAFEHWLDFNADLWDEIYNDTSLERSFEHTIYASDTSYYAIEATKKNLSRLQLQHVVQLKQIRVEEIRRDPQPPALVMCNPPYGERMYDNHDICALYKSLGDTFKHQFAGSTAWIISSNIDAMKCVGLKPSAKISLQNGELPCTFNRYDLFAGEHKEWKRSRVS